MSVDRGDSIPPELDASSPHFDSAAALAAGPSRVRLPRPKTKVASACDRTVSLSGDAHGWRAQLSDHPPAICRQRRGRRWITSAPRENFSHHIGGSSARTHPRYRSVRPGAKGRGDPHATTLISSPPSLSPPSRPFTQRRAATAAKAAKAAAAAREHMKTADWSATRIVAPKAATLAVREAKVAAEAEQVGAWWVRLRSAM